MGEMPWRNKDEYLHTLDINLHTHMYIYKHTYTVQQHLFDLFQNRSIFLWEAPARHVLLGRSAARCPATLLPGAHSAGAAALPTGGSSTGLLDAGGEAAKPWGRRLGPTWGGVDYGRFNMI